MASSVLSPNTLIVPSGAKDCFLLYQDVLRAGVLVSNRTLRAMLENLGAAEPVHTEGLEAVDVTAFSLARCLHDNASGVVLDSIPALQTFSWNQLYALLERHGLVGDEETYLPRRGRKIAALDRHHVGNFHQQMGAFLARERRQDPESWWVTQKFQEDHTDFRDTIYGWVQGTWLRDWIPSAVKSGERWLDFGCGIGFYSRLLAQAGANVLGLDPSANYIAAAKENCRGLSAEFRVQDFSTVDDFAALGKNTFDRIFLADVLLYFFDPYRPLELTPSALLRALAERLTPAGRIWVLDPHGAFFLQPRLGGRAPTVLCTEYKTRHFRVTPTLEEFSRAVEEAGLHIRSIREPVAEAPAPDSDSMRHFASEFPSWWLFELAGGAR